MRIVPDRRRPRILAPGPRRAQRLTFESRGGGSQSRTGFRRWFHGRGSARSSSLAGSHIELRSRNGSPAARGRGGFFLRSGSTCAECERWLPILPGARRASLARLHSSLGYTHQKSLLENRRALVGFKQSSRLACPDTHYIV